MDALAGYGSDSTSSSANSVKNNKCDTQSTNDGDGTLSGLLVNYSDEEDDDKTTGSASQKIISRKRPRISNEKSNDTSPSRKKNDLTQPPTNIPHCLPPPQLAVHTTSSPHLSSHSSLVEFDVDYTAQLPPPPPANDDDAHLVAKLENLHRTFSSSLTTSTTTPACMSFASNLRSKKEFGNPHMFPSIVTHYGIDAWGSNLPKKWTGGFSRFEYVERIVEREEETRIKAFEQRRKEEHDDVGEKSCI